MPSDWQQHRLRTRADFVRAYDHGQRYHGRHFVLFAVQRRGGPDDEGFGTVPAVVTAAHPAAHPDAHSAAVPERVPSPVPDAVPDPVPDAVPDAATLPWRIGVTATRKFAGAVGRNRLRRVVRAWAQGADLPAGYDYVVVPKRGLDPRSVTLQLVTADLGPLVTRHGRQLDRA